MIAWVIAGALHVLLFASIPEFRHTVQDIIGSTADFVEVEAEAPPEPPPQPTPPPRAERTAPRDPTNSNEPPPPVQESTAPPPEVITTLDGTTLGNFTINQGTGDATQPIRMGTQSDRNTEGSLNGVPDAGVPGSTGPTPDSDLSIRASAPSGLNELLNRYYPADARQQGVEGRAIVAIEVRADGSLGRIQVRRETVRDYEFGQACVRMLRASGRWEPGRDQSGDRVTSVLNFSCDFEIRR